LCFESHYPDDVGATVARFANRIAAERIQHRAIDKVRRAGLRPAFDSPIGMGFRFWWRAERWHTQSGPEARAPAESVDDFVNGPGIQHWFGSVCVDE